MAPYKKKKVAKNCSKLKPNIKPKRPKVKKPEATCPCPHCNGSGRIAKKKNQKPRSYFPYFFQHVCRRARESNVQQLKKITMKRAADCWNTLTEEQKGDFITKVQRTLGTGGGRAKSPGPSAPGKRGCAPKCENNHEERSCDRDALARDTRKDFIPSASDSDDKASRLDDLKSKQPNDEKAPKDDTSLPSSPFGDFDRFRPSGKFL